MLHHLELWVQDLEASEKSLGWLLLRLGFEPESRWNAGVSYRHGDFYIVLESGPDVVPGAHERTRAGLNHLAFKAGSPQQVEELAADALAHGFTLLFADRQPYAGGRQHYAAYVADEAGFEVELVASAPGS
ncbi:glyoxalase [Arthrobacter sp. LS16]|nr:glyoxalase [Arthrobacter sp. LS16]